MDTYKSYAERVIQPTPTILGLKLLNFTLGHSMLLKTAKSRFMLGGLKELDDRGIIGELIFGLLVCSTTYDSFIEEMNDGSFKEYLNKYVADLIEEIKSSSMFNLYSKINMFANYIKDGTSTPYYYTAEDAKNDVSICPVEIEQSIISTLMSECNYTRDECLNVPLTETLSAYLLYAHKQGTVNLQSKEEYELQLRLKGAKRE